LLGWAGRNVPELIGVVAMLAALVIGVGRGSEAGRARVRDGDDEAVPSAMVTA
jgi:hypothetical protein